MEHATHVWVRKGKVTPLGPRFHGPYPITAKHGTSCIEVRVGHYANGAPRHELHHWRNVKIVPFENEPYDATRQPLGRPPRVNNKGDDQGVAKLPQEEEESHPYNLRSRRAQKDKQT